MWLIKEEYPCLMKNNKDRKQDQQKMPMNLIAKIQLKIHCLISVDNSEKVIMFKTHIDRHTSQTHSLVSNLGWETQLINNLHYKTNGSPRFLKDKRAAMIQIMMK